MTLRFKSKYFFQSDEDLKLLWSGQSEASLLKKQHEVAEKGKNIFFTSRSSNVNVLRVKPSLHSNRSFYCFVLYLFIHTHSK